MNSVHTQSLPRRRACARTAYRVFLGDALVPGLHCTACTGLLLCSGGPCTRGFFVQVAPNKSAALDRHGGALYRMCGGW